MMWEDYLGQDTTETVADGMTRARSKLRGLDVQRGGRKQRDPGASRILADFVIRSSRISERLPPSNPRRSSVSPFISDARKRDLLELLAPARFARSTIQPHNCVPKVSESLASAGCPAPSAISTCRSSIAGFQQFGCRARRHHSWIAPQIVAAGVEDDWDSVADSSGQGVQGRAQNRE